MKIFLGVMTMGLAMSGLGFSNPAVVKADKGEVIVAYDDNQDQALAYKVVLPPGCGPATSVDVAGGAANLSFTHSGASCPHGAKIYVTVGPEVSSLEVGLNAGVITAMNSLCQAAASIQAKVEAGTIQSQLLAVRSINFYAGKQGSYDSQDDAKSLQVKLAVNAGTLMTE